MGGTGRALSRASAVLGLLAAGVTGLVPGVASAQSARVSPGPVAGTPQLAPNGTTEQVRQLVQCGGTMYAVGRFTRISQGGVTYPRDNIVSFSASPPYRVTSWAPSVNGTVNSIALAANCATAYIGGTFSKVAGSAAANLAAVSTSHASLVGSWAHHTNGQVNTVLRAPIGHLLVGGQFTSVNGTSRDYYASLSLRTGRDDGYVHGLRISGSYSYPGADPNHTGIFNQQLSPDGQHVLVEGTFTRVQGNARQQIFMLNLGRGHGNVSNWYSPEFSRFCAADHPFYLKAAAWSPDGSTVYVATTGYHPAGWKNTFPLTGLCDAVAAFPGTRQGGLAHEWVNYTGCDSLASVAADASAVYAGGHERWGNNGRGCNAAGSGAISSPGMGGYTSGPKGGALITAPGRPAGEYSRGRGVGADDMLITRAGLWIASDNLDGTDTCGGIHGHAGICLLPYSS
jgi:hypothetical protein